MRPELVIDQVENYSIYVVASARWDGGYHWGFFVPTNKPIGNVWHVTGSNDTAWYKDFKESNKVLDSVSVTILCKVGTINSENWERAKAAIANVPVGHPSVHTGEEFRCKVWIQDVLMALHNNSVTVLRKDVKYITEAIIGQAAKNRQEVEENSGPPVIWNVNGLTASSS